MLECRLTTNRYSEPKKYAEGCLNHYEIYGNATSHPVVFDNLSSLPYRDKVTEALDILIAGADTTASTLTAGMMHILLNPKIHARLVDALGGPGAAHGNSRAFQLLELEKIDYLVSQSNLLSCSKLNFDFRQTACVKESLRIGMAVPGRLPRIVPHNLAQPFIVDGKVIPPGVRNPFFFRRPLWILVIIPNPVLTLCRPLSLSQRIQCTPAMKYGVPMHAHSIQIVGYILDQNLWISTCVPFLRAPGCVLDRSKSSASHDLHRSRKLKMVFITPQ